jgi:hypothetical protein
MCQSKKSATVDVRLFEGGLDKFTVLVCYTAIITVIFLVMMVSQGVP